MNERWLPVVGYEGRYEVSDAGSVRSIDRVTHHSRGVNFRSIKGAVLNQGTNTKGYSQVTLCGGGVSGTHPIHKLVSLAFMGDPNGLQVDHIDGDKKNNRLENLEYVTNRENTLRYRQGKRELPVGVCLPKSLNRYRAQIYRGKDESHHIGYYDTAQEASDAYQKELRLLEKAGEK